MIYIRFLRFLNAVDHCATGAPVTVTVGNNVTGSLMDTTLLCELNAQINFSPEQVGIRVPPGPFLTLSNLGSFISHLGGFGSNLRCSACERKLLIRRFGERSLV